MTCTRLSVVATVFNEYGSLPAWLAAFEQQHVQPAEYVFVDGGSSDGTWELLDGWQAPARKILIQKHGCSISEGRNLGIEHASGEFVAVTDAGTVAAPDWISNIVEPLLNRDVDVVSGFFVSSADSVWHRTLAATTLPDLNEIAPESFLPSSRSLAFRRSWFNAGFRYPEWLDYCEDLIFDLQLKKGGARFEFAPNAYVSFEPRSTPGSYMAQYYRYARGDGKAGLYYLRHGIRYSSYALLMIVLARRRPPELIAIGAIGLLSLHKPFRRLVMRRTTDQPVIRTVAESQLVILQRLAGDVAKMAGFPAGVFWRLKRFGIGGLRLGWRNINYDGSLLPR